MIGTFTRYWQAVRLDMLLGGVHHAVPSLYYFGLSRGPSNADGLVDEPPAEWGYARVPYPNTPEAWSHYVDGFAPPRRSIRANADAFAFPAPTGDWGRVLSLFVADSPTGGNVLLSAPVRWGDPSPALGPPTVAAGAFIVMAI